MKKVTKQYLRNNPNVIFVFGDNSKRLGKLGTSFLRDELNTYGFVIKKNSKSDASSYFEIEEYSNVYFNEIDKFRKEVMENRGRIFLIDDFGKWKNGDINLFDNFLREKMIDDLSDLDNVKFLWDGVK